MVRTSSNFTWEKVKRQSTSLENGQLLSEFLQKIGPASISRDWRIKIHQSSIRNSIIFSDLDKSQQPITALETTANKYQAVVCYDLFKGRLEKPREKSNQVIFSLCFRKVYSFQRLMFRLV